MPVPYTRDRAALEKAIQNGGSVMLPDGRIVSRVEELPDESLLAGQDVDRHQAEVDRLQAAHDQAGQQLKAAQGKLADAKKTQQANPPKGQQQGGQSTGQQAGQADAGQGAEQATDAGAEPPRGHAGHHGRK